jgi:hypothetical protein
VNGGLFGARRGAVDADVLADKVLLGVLTDAPVRIDQSTSALGADLTVVDILGRLGVRVGLRLLLAQALIERLALQGLVRRGAEALAAVALGR